MTVAPRKRVDNGGQGAGKEVEKHGQSRAKVPAGSVRVLPDSGRKWGKGDDEQQEEKDRGGGMDGEESSWDRYVMWDKPMKFIDGKRIPQTVFTVHYLSEQDTVFASQIFLFSLYSRHKFFFSLFLSEDSNEHLTTKDLMSVPTSTPVQVCGYSFCGCSLQKKTALLL